MNAEPVSPAKHDIAVRRMTAADHDVVDEILADAFFESPITAKIFGDGDPRGRLRLLNRRSVRNSHASGMVADVAGQPVGALIASGSPRCEPQGLAGFGSLIDAIRAIRWRMPKVMAMFRATARNHPEWPHRHLVILGVHRRFQGRGVGAALLERFCQDLDGAGANSFLETDTEAARRLYERFGYVETNRTLHGGMPFIYMWRTPRRPL